MRIFFSEFVGLWQLKKTFIRLASLAQKKYDQNQKGSLFKRIIDSLKYSVQFDIIVHVTITSELFMDQLVINKDIENTRVVHVCFAGNSDFVGTKFVQNLRLNKLKFWTVISYAAVNDIYFHAWQSPSNSPHFFWKLYLIKTYWNEAFVDFFGIGRASRWIGNFFVSVCLHR